MAKLDTAKAIISTVQSLSEATDTADSRVSEYFDVGTFTDSDLTAINITAAQLASCVTLLQQLSKMMNNQAVSQAMYRTTLNTVRRVSV